jgi:hypothetical protein
MCSRELSLDLLPSPFCSLNRSSGEFTVGPSLFDELHDPLSTVVLCNFTIRESVCEVAVEGLAVYITHELRNSFHTR